MKPITFYNHWHNGDLHISREYVKDIIGKIAGGHFSYYHPNDPKILSDIGGFTFLPLMPAGTPKMCIPDLMREDADVIFVDTHINSKSANFAKYGNELETLYRNFCCVFEELKLEIGPKDSYIPLVDFSAFETAGIDGLMAGGAGRKKILVSNNYVCSKQSNNFNMDSLVSHIASRFKDAMVIVTNDSDCKEGNVVRIMPLVQHACNVNECAYAALSCDVVLGRHSGPFSFTLNRNMLLSDRRQLIVCMSSLPPYHTSPMPNKRIVWHKLLHDVSFDAAELEGFLDGELDGYLS